MCALFIALSLQISFKEADILKMFVFVNVFKHNHINDNYSFKLNTITFFIYFIYCYIIMNILTAVSKFAPGLSDKFAYCYCYWVNNGFT